MNANVIPLRPHLHTRIGHVIRAGEKAHRRYGRPLAAGRFPAEHVIADASRAKFRKELIRALQDMARSAPWAATTEGQPLGLRDFQPNANIDPFGRIARMAVDIEPAGVMSPTRFLPNGADDPYLPIDPESVTHPRSALDREGGMSIDVDYTLIAPHTLLRTRTHRTRLMGALKLPFDSPALGLFGFDGTFGKRDPETIAAASGGRRPVACPDRGRCPRGLDSMPRRPRPFHPAAVCRDRSVRRGAGDGACRPLPRRRTLTDRTARGPARLQTGDARLDRALEASGKRTDDTAGTFETLAERERRAPPPPPRGSHRGTANEGRAP